MISQKWREKICAGCPHHYQMRDVEGCFAAPQPERKHGEQRTVRTLDSLPECPDAARRARAEGRA